MRVSIIQFSPSGSVAKLSSMLKQVFEERGSQVQLLDMAGSDEIFLEHNIPAFLDRVAPHNVLLIGAPVYAHHLQYHVQNLIKALPVPDTQWGRLAVPYVCYGGISSGIALKEAGALLKKSGRIVPCALKVSAPHSMTRAFMLEMFNNDKLRGGVLPEVSELADRIMAGMPEDNSASFAYNGLISTLKARFIFKEKLWHEKRYPKISIDQALCTNCGLCAGRCPVLHLRHNDGNIGEDSQSPCIHCFSCVSACPVKAIKLIGDSEKGRAFMAKMISKTVMNREMPETAVYPLAE